MKPRVPNLIVATTSPVVASVRLGRHSFGARMTMDRGVASMGPGFRIYGD